MEALNELLLIPFTHVLFQCDFTIYGNAVREAVRCRQPGGIMSHVRNNAMVAYGPRSSQDALERGLHFYYAAPPRNHVHPITTPAPGVTAVRYSLHLDDDDPRATTDLVVSFVSVFSRQHTESLASRNDFDVSMLEVDRMGLRLRRVPPALRTHPCPLQHVISQCLSSRLDVYAEPLGHTADAFIASRLRAMLSRGWTFASAGIRTSPPPMDDRCAICLHGGDSDDSATTGESDASDVSPRHVVINGGTWPGGTSDTSGTSGGTGGDTGGGTGGGTSGWVELTDCGHRYHSSCLRRHCATAIEESLECNRSVRCPVCRNPVLLYRVMPCLDVARV